MKTLSFIICTLSISVALVGCNSADKVTQNTIDQEEVIAKMSLVP